SADYLLRSVPGTHDDEPIRRFHAESKSNMRTRIIGNGDRIRLALTERLADTEMRRLRGGRRRASVDGQA
ncbi:hypothetical protein, partial [Bradyrhizobium sp.]|uniref:hypothetical protein n=1 Tax=Bradyrhizobium sp. TaxID=376 RepID=UPI003D0AB14C